MQSQIEAVVIRNFTPEDAPNMVALQQRCLDVCPDISLLEAGFYYAPGFENGKNIFCAVDAEGTLVGHVVVYPTYISPRLAARVLWMDLRVDPAFAQGARLKRALLTHAIARAREIATARDERLVLSATYFARGEASIRYLLSQGFVRYERCYQLRRDLSQPLPEVLDPRELLPDLEIRPWRMETEAEQRRYIAAYNEAFQGNHTRDLGALQHFMRSEMWAVGTSFAAFSDQEVVGSVMAYYEPDRERNPDRVGMTEYVFVRAPWQGRGIAKFLLKEALVYLKSHDVTRAELEVLAENSRALTLYESMGYMLSQEEISLGLYVDDDKEIDHDVCECS